MDGLHIVALLDRQRRAEQQLGHAQHAVHGRTDFVADLGQELGLGVDLGIAGGQCTAGAEALFAHASQAFADRQVQQQAADDGQAHEHAQQPGRGGAGQAQQRRQQYQPAKVIDHHGEAEQTGWRIALVPVEGADQQHADTAQGQQRIGHQVERQGVDEQQHQAADCCHQHLALQQAVQPRRIARREEMQGEIQPGQAREHQGEIGSGRLRTVPHMPPGAAKIEQDQPAEQHQPVVQGQNQGSAGAAIEEADQVVQDQHHQAAKEHAEQQWPALVRGSHGGGLQADRRAQLML
ncbi:hypothetical protein D3C76_470250 [compost metagenome]